VNVVRWMVITVSALLACVLLSLLALHKDSAISTEIWIDSSPQQVWHVLTDTAKYPAWNPMISRLTGDLREGNVIAFVAGSGSDGMTFHPTVLRVRPAEELRWKGYLLMPGLFDGEHRFILTQQGRQTHLVQSEQFTGLLAGRLTDAVVSDTAAQMKAMNTALQQRCAQFAARDH
jgi:hypothetical protein